MSKRSEELARRLKSASAKQGGSNAVANSAVTREGGGATQQQSLVPAALALNFSMMTQGDRETALKAGTHFEVEVDLLDGDPNQPRKTFEGIEDLAQTIQSQGLIQLPVVRKHPLVPGRFMVVVGERRTRAVRLLGWKTMEVSLVDWDETKVRAAQIIENTDFGRKNVKPIEEAVALQDLVDRLGDVSKVIAFTGMSQAVVYKRIQLLKMPDEVKALIDAGVVTDMEVAGDLCRLQKKSESAFSALAKDGGATGSIDRKAARFALRAVSGTPATLAHVTEQCRLKVKARSVVCSVSPKGSTVTFTFEDGEQLERFMKSHWGLSQR